MTERKTVSSVHLDMGSVRAGTPEELENNLRFVVANVAQDNNCVIPNGLPSHQAFSYLVRELSQRAPVVILVDEYDKPLLGQLEDQAKIEARDYHRRFMGGTKEVVLIGAVFDPKTRTIGAWKEKQPTIVSYNR